MSHEPDYAQVREIARQTVSARWYTRVHQPLEERFATLWQAAKDAPSDLRNLISEYHYARVRQVRQLENALRASQSDAQEPPARVT